MMKIICKLRTTLLFIALIFTAVNCIAQFDSDSLLNQKKQKSTYFQTDFSIPLRANPYRNQFDNINEDQNEYWFLPDGINARVGFGIHYKKWIAVGLHTGIDWKATEKLVAAPIFGNIKFSPRLTKEYNSRLFLSFGYGQIFALGRGNLKGEFVSGKLGIEGFDSPTNATSFFIDVSHYQIPLRNYTNGYGSFSLGLAFNFY